jgi:hypothetical protein
MELPAVNGPLTLEIDNPAGLILDQPLTLKVLLLTNGAIDNSANPLILQNQSSIVRSAGGSLTSAPIFSGTALVSYQGLGSITTGPEIPIANNVLTELDVFAENVILNSNVTINGTLYFSSSYLKTGNSNVSALSISGEGPSGYVITDGAGTLTIKNISTTSVLFPIGTSASNYTPITISNGSGDDFSVRDHSSFTNAPADATKAVNVEWIVNKTGSGTNVTLTPEWNTDDEGSNFVRTDPLVLGHYGTSWDEIPTGTVSGTGPYTTTVTGSKFIFPIWSR